MRRQQPHMRPARHRHQDPIGQVQLVYGNRSSSEVTLQAHMTKSRLAGSKAGCRVVVPPSMARPA